MCGCGVKAEADLASSFGLPVTFNDSDGAYGFRSRAFGGIKFHIFEGLAVTELDRVDYWSDAPFADQSSVGLSGQLPTVVFDDLVEVKVELVLKRALGGAPN